MFGRKTSFDAQPTKPVSVLLASTGGEFRRESIRLCQSLAVDRPVAVLVIARIYGSSFGLPNPGLLPTIKERRAAQDRVDQAMQELRALGVASDGQVLITRHGTRGIARVARARSAQFVVVEAPHQSPLRRLVEGGFESEIRRRLRATSEVTSAPYDPALAGP
jgi:hypothetical protein